MELIVNRYARNEQNSTIHSHIILRDKNLQFCCQGIERMGDEIPKGTYSASVTYSPKFDRNLYLIDVPQRQGIRIHSGNTSKDSTGCIILGDHRINDFIFNSKKTLSTFHVLSEGQNLNIHIYEKNHRKYLEKSIGTLFRHFIKWTRKNATN